MEVTTIPDIRERNDRPKDKQPKHQAVSIVQRQMVQRFVKELNDSANQPDRSDSAERTATEQVETTTREIVHEAVQLPRRAIQHPARRESADSSANAQLEQSAQPHHAPESPRERTDAPRTQPDATPPQSTPTPAPQEQVRRAYVQQTAKTAASALPITSEQPWARHVAPSAPLTENTPRQHTEDIRTRPEPQRPQSTPAPTPQEQARRAYVQQATKEIVSAPPITPEQPEAQHPTATTPTAENAPRRRTNDVRARTEPKQLQSPPAPIPQEQGRRAHAKRTKKSRAEKPAARDNLYTEQPEIRLADDLPEHEPPPIREKPNTPENRGQVQSEAAPAKPSAVRHVKQPDAWTPRSAATPVMRGKEQPVRERSAVTPAHDLPPVPQEQARQVFVEKQAQLSQNPSIHPNRLPRFYRSRLFRSRLQSRRSVSRSRLAAANRSHPRSGLFSHHRCKLHQQTRRLPSVKSRSQTPHRGNAPSIVFLFIQGIRSKSAHQRQRRKRLHRKPRQNAHGKQPHRMHRERCLKRATTGRPAQPSQPRKSWLKPRQKPSRS